MNLFKNISIIFIFISSAFTQFEYSFEDMNSTSTSFGNNVWLPIYSDHITMHFFSSQG